MSNAIEKSHNPFSTQVSAPHSNAVADSDAERAIQEVQAAMVIAKKFPRDRMQSVDAILNDCTRPTLAQSAIYSYPRGGQEVTGPSIRLAEAMAQTWGNIQFGIRELSQSGGSSTVEAFAWDMETNTRQVKVFQVEHVRYTRKSGLTKLTDPRDIYELVANQGARRLRACILGVIPGDVTEAAVEACKVTQAASVDVTPDTIKAMLESFESNFGVTQTMIEKRLGKHIESINPAQYLSLRNIFAGMKDGISKPQDWFEVDSIEVLQGPKSSDINEAVKAAAKKSPAKKAPPEIEKMAKEMALESAQQTSDDEMAEPQQTEKVMYVDVAQKLTRAETPGEWSEAVDYMKAFLEVPENVQFEAELKDVADSRLRQLKNKSAS